MGVSNGWEGVMNEDPGGRGGDPLSLSNLDLNDIFFVYG